MLSSRDILTRSGTVSVEIDTTATDEITVSKLGSIVFENDIDRGEQTVNTLSTSYGAISVEFWDNTLNQVSLFDTIRANSADNIPARVVIEQDGVSYDFPFTVRKSQIEYDERAGITTIQFVPPVFPDIGTQALIDASSDTENWDGGGSHGGTFACLTAHDFINEALSYLGSPTTTIIESRTIAVNYVQGGENLRLQSIYDSATRTLDRIHFVVTRRVNNRVSDVIARLASLNSALFGVAFSTAYWIPKNSVATPVTLSANELDNLSVIPMSRSVRAISVRLVGSGTNSNILADTVATRSYNEGGDRAITYAHNVGDNFNIGVWKTTKFEGDGIMSHIRNAGGSQPEEFLVGQPGITGAVDSIASVYGAGGNRIRISATINDFYALKPWECFQFDTTVPVRYRNRIYRPSLLEYDLISGIIKLTAYSIT
jgi:hypothetical protein